MPRFVQHEFQAWRKQLRKDLPAVGEHRYRLAEIDHLFRKIKRQRSDKTALQGDGVGIDRGHDRARMFVKVLGDAGINFKPVELNTGYEF